jgi:predicted nucleic acid-binding protein
VSDPRVFIDASFWIAYRDPREEAHPLARETVGRLFQTRTTFVTTVPVFCEIHAYFVRSPRHRQRVLNDFWRNPLVHIEETMHADQMAALELLEKHEDKSYSFCDALSFVVMRRLGLARVASFDGHFRQFGEFELICSLPARPGRAA